MWKVPLGEGGDAGREDELLQVGFPRWQEAGESSRQRGRAEPGCRGQWEDQALSYHQVQEPQEQRGSQKAGGTTQGRMRDGAVGMWLRESGPGADWVWEPRAQGTQDNSGFGAGL